MVLEPHPWPLGDGEELGLSSPDANSKLRPYVPHRGPVIVSSDEESELGSTHPQVPRALSRTPSWARSGISPSASQEEFRPVNFTEPRSVTIFESDLESKDRRMAEAFGSPGGESPTEGSYFRGSRSAEPVIGSFVASRETSRWGSVFESDSEHGSSSGESGRIRDTGAGSGSNWGRVLLPSESGWGSSSEGDSREEFNLKEDRPQVHKSSSRDDFVLSKIQTSSDQSVRSSSSAEFIVSDSPSKMLDSSSRAGRIEEELSPKDNSEMGPKREKSNHRSRWSSSKQNLAYGGAEKKKSLRPRSSNHSSAGYESTEEPHPLDIPDSPQGTGFDGLGPEARQSTAFNANSKSKTRSGGIADSFESVTQVKGHEGRRSHKPTKKPYKLNPDYVELLNEDICLAASSGRTEAETKQKSRIMGSVWTEDERTTFFNHLSIVGKDNLSGLARRIGTKSVVECRAYLKALQDGKEDVLDFPFYTRSHRRRDQVSVKDIPAAVELSDECVKALEMEADYLEYRTRKYEESREKTKWGEFWLLDSATAEHIEHLYKAERLEEILGIAPEAELLNLENMLELSECWTHWGEDPPSIRHTALFDIHTLVVSLTRRLVQSTLFMAMSRLRSTDHRIFRQKSLIRPSDVAAAIDCLGAPRKSNYWAMLPRRLGLKVYRKARQIRLTDKNTISYDKLEEDLCGRGSTVGGGGDECSGTDMDALILSAYESELEGSADDELSSFDESTDIDGDSGSETDGYQFVDDDGRPYQSKSQKKRDTKLAALEDHEDVFMEALDQQQSLKAEVELWQVIGKEPSKPLPQDKIRLPKKPDNMRKRPWEILDWRDGVDYLAPWEIKKRRKARHGVIDEEMANQEDQEGDRGDSSTIPAASISALEKVIALRKSEAIPYRGLITKKQLATKREALRLVSRSPRGSRVRRQSRAFAGFVSTVENVAESDAEVLAREQGGCDSPSEEEYSGGDHS